jgi:hypothetical protein
VSESELGLVSVWASEWVLVLVLVSESESESESELVLELVSE